MSLVYYDAGAGTVHTMNAEWNTVLGEDDPLTIPGGTDMSSPRGMYGTEVGGRTALVGGFMKGVGAAHERFGRLPWAERRPVGREGGRGGAGRWRPNDRRGPDRYEVLWQEPLVADLGGGYTVYTNPPPNAGGVALIEAQRGEQRFRGRGGARGYSECP